MRKTLLALLLVGPVVTAQSAPPAVDGFDSVRSLIRRQMTERQVPSVAVVVARDGRIIVEEAFGWAGFLTGTMMGDIGTEDASRTPHTLSVTLKLRSGALVGGMTALSLPAKRVGNALTHWVELKKE